MSSSHVFQSGQVKQPRNRFRPYLVSGSDRLSDIFSAITALVGRTRSDGSGLSVENGWHGSPTRFPDATWPDLAKEFTDYISAYLSTALGAPYVATIYEPRFGRLNANKAWNEAYFQMAWEPVELGAKPRVFELAIGAKELTFSALIIPQNRDAQADLAARLSDKADLVVDRMWENSLRFVPGADDQSWRRWSASWSYWAPKALGRAPKQFGVMMESGPVVTPVAAGQVAYHVSDSVRRVRAVLDIL